MIKQFEYTGKTMRLDDLINLLKTIRNKYGNLEAEFEHRDVGDIPEIPKESYGAIIKTLPFKDYMVYHDRLLFQNKDNSWQYHDENGIHVMNEEQ